jgi:sugar O-acyltransferase (sialic acid O-acetyltransferase NeuD family)
MKVLIIGSGGHARVTADILLVMKGLEPLGFVSRADALKRDGPQGLPILGDDDIVETIEHDRVVVAIGENGLRKRVFDRLVGAGEKPVSAIHPTAIIASDVIVGAGCVICAGAIVNTGSRIGDNVILNTGCTVDHDCIVGNHAHIAPGVNLAGNVLVGEGVFVGIGSSVVQGVVLGEWVTVGAGAAVVSDVAANIVAVGVPARAVIKDNDGV